MFGSDYKLLYSTDDEFTLSSLLQSLNTKDFAIFVAMYYAYYIIMVLVVSSVAIKVFKVDYSNITLEQLKREIPMTIESYTTNALCYWIILRFVSNWRTSHTDIKDIMASYLINNIVFSAWFYFNHKLWHANRFLYKWIHSHHHESVLVCPLTALSNRWTESAATSFGFLIGPYFFGATNVYGWYMSIFSIVGEAIIGHSRIPFTLEHATHHALYTVNYGFYSDWTARLNWDKLVGTWVYSSNTPKIKKLYPKESTNYTWNHNARHINWENIAMHS